MIESLEAKLQERCESPGSSRPPSESSRSATSTSFVSDVLEPCSDGEAASECSQCPEEPTRLPGTVSWGQAAPLQCMAAAQSPTLTSLFLCLLSPGLHFDTLSKPNSVPLPALAPTHSFLPTGLPVPLDCCGTRACSLAEAQQELQVLQRQLGESEHAPLARAWSSLPCCTVLHGLWPPSLNVLPWPFSFSPSPSALAGGLWGHVDPLYRRKGWWDAHPLEKAALGSHWVEEGLRLLNVS